MPPRYYRDAEFYRAPDGSSDVIDELRRVQRSDPRALRTIQNKIDLLRQQTLDDALRSELIRKASATIYVLRVQGGASVAYRLPFFEPLCRGGSLIVFTHGEQRRDLRGDGYGSLIVKAESARMEWIDRNCDEGMSMRADELFDALSRESPVPPDVAATVDPPFILAANVYRLRKAHGLTQRTLAQKVGVAQPRIAEIERGDANPTLGTLSLLAHALGVSVSELLSRECPDVPADASLALDRDGEGEEGTEGRPAEGLDHDPASRGGEPPKSRVRRG